MDTDRPHGSSNEWGEEHCDSPPGFAAGFFLADQACRLLMMKKAAGVCVQIAHDEAPVSWTISVREITRPS